MMHEMSIALSVVDIVESFAREKQAERVVSVTVDIGDFSGVEAGAMPFCYEAASKGTIAEGSQLLVNRIGARARCPECGKEFTPTDRVAMCPDCLSFGCPFITGEELAVKKMEIE